MLKSTFRVWTLQEAENEGMSGFLGDDDGTPYTPAAEVISRKSLEYWSCSSTGAGKVSGRARVRPELPCQKCQ